MKKTTRQLDHEIAEALGGSRRRAHSTRKGWHEHGHVALKPWAGSKVQSLLFDKQWTVHEARQWARDHGYRNGKVHETDNYIRLRQFEPVSGTEKRTITFGQGIKAIVEEVK
jgi:hypothetical protein